MRETEKEYYHGKRRVAREETGDLWLKLSSYVVVFVIGMLAGIYRMEMPDKRLPRSMSSLSALQVPGGTIKVEVNWLKGSQIPECKYFFKTMTEEWSAKQCTGAFVVDWGNK